MVILVVVANDYCGGNGGGGGVGRGDGGSTEVRMMIVIETVVSYGHGV